MGSAFDNISVIIGILIIGYIFYLLLTKKEEAEEAIKETVKEVEDTVKKVEEVALEEIKEVEEFAAKEVKKVTEKVKEATTKRGRPKAKK